MIKLITFAAAHIDLLDLTEEEMARHGMGTDFKSLGDFLEKTSWAAFTCIHDGRVVGIGGVRAKSEKVAYGWTLPNKYFKQTGIAGIRLVYRWLDAAQEQQFHRIETYNLETAELHHRWCEMLGFTSEGPMRYYDDQGRTYIRYARIRGGLHGS